MPIEGEGEKDVSPSTEHRNMPVQPDEQLTQDFLNGIYCLRGVSMYMTLCTLC